MYIDYNSKKTINPKGLELAKSEGFAKKWDDLSRFSSVFWLQFFVGDILDSMLEGEANEGLGYNSLLKLCEMKTELDGFAYVFQGCEKELSYLSALASKLCTFLEKNSSYFDLTKDARHSKLNDVVDIEKLSKAFFDLKSFTQKIQETHFYDPEFCELITSISKNMISNANKSL